MVNFGQNKLSWALIMTRLPRRIFKTCTSRLVIPFMKNILLIFPFLIGEILSRTNPLISIYWLIFQSFFDYRRFLWFNCFLTKHLKHSFLHKISENICNQLTNKHKHIICSLRNFFSLIRSSKTANCLILVFFIHDFMIIRTYLLQITRKTSTFESVSIFWVNT